MPILREIPIALAAHEIVASNNKQPIRPALLRDAEAAITLGQTLWQPAAIYDWFDIRGVDGEWIRISSRNSTDVKAHLHVGPKANLLEPAQRALVSVVTIGPALEQHVHELNVEREGLKAYMLDSAGVVALGSVGEAVRCVVEETAADLGWGVSPSLSPGSLAGWSLRGQRDLCSLLPLESIGVRLNSHYVLEPHKSASGIVGLGPGYDSPQVGSVCKYCALQKTCWRRREDAS